MKNFYMTCIRSIVLYACPSWYSFLSEDQKTRIRRVEGIALKIMEPQCDSYEDRICQTKLTPILNVFNNTSQQYITKILHDDRHCLHELATSYKPPVPPRRSTRLAQKPKPTTRTNLCIL